jgi:hypothetical protein
MKTAMEENSGYLEDNLKGAGDRTLGTYHLAESTPTTVIRFHNRDDIVY